MHYNYCGQHMPNQKKNNKMYDYIKFEIDNNTNSRDLDKRFPAEYPWFIQDEMLCWSECGCHWTISAPVAEEYHLREWLMEAGLQMTKYEYSKRVPDNYYRDELVYGLREKKTEFDKYLSELAASEIQPAGSDGFESGARYKLVYHDPDDVENLYHTHTQPISLYREASIILGLAIDELAKYPSRVKQASCAVSGFYAAGGSNPKLLNLDLQPGKEIRLFDFQIRSHDISSSWSCKLLAVRVAGMLEGKQKTNDVVSNLTNNKFSGNRISIV